jgi:hypothetical protein
MYGKISRIQGRVLHFTAVAVYRTAGWIRFAARPCGRDILRYDCFRPAAGKIFHAGLFAGNQTLCFICRRKQADIRLFEK